MIILAPIILFVYNRPWHTEQTLEALMANELANQSTLYIYADGPKIDATPEQLKKIEAVRSLIRTKQWCKEVHIIEANENKGLEPSVISGITEVLENHDRIIVLEDDIVSSPGFLKFMNESLELYKNEDKVAGISAYSFIKSKDETFFLTAGGNWGWATWKRAWDKVIFDSDYYIPKFNDKLKRGFNLDNQYDYYKMLVELQTWDVQFYCSNFLDKKLYLLPKTSMTINIGFDEGTHYNGGARISTKEYVKLPQEIVVERIEINEKYNNKSSLINYFKKRNSRSILNRIYRKLRKISNL